MSALGPRLRESINPKFTPEFVHAIRTPAAVPVHKARTVHKEQAFAGPSPAGNDGSRSLVQGPLSASEPEPSQLSFVQFVPKNGKDLGDPGGGSANLGTKVPHKLAIPRRWR